MNNNPAKADTNRSSVSTKIFLIIAIFSLPIGVLAYLLAANYTPQIEVANLELAGNAVQKPLMKTMADLFVAGSTMQGCAAENCASELAKQVALVASSFDEAASVNSQHASELGTTNDGLAGKSHQNLELDSLKSQFNTLVTTNARVSGLAERDALTAGCTALAEKVREFVSYVGDTSNLILDPDLDSYYLVDVTLLAMPGALSHIANAASIGTKLLAGSGTDVDRASLVNESVAIQQFLDRIAASNKMTLDSDAANHGVSPTLEPNLRPALESYQTTVGKYLLALKSVVANPTQITAATLAEQAAAAQKASLHYWNTGASELDALLAIRNASFKSSRLQALGFSALAVALAAFIAYVLGRSITKPLRELVRNLGPGATLLGVSVERIAEASQSKTPSADEAAIICEELNAHAENMRQAVLELARHVEGSGAARIATATDSQAHS